MSCTKFHCSWTNTFCLRPGGINYTRRHFLGTVPLWTLSRHRHGKTSKLIQKGLQWNSEVLGFLWLPSGSSWRCRSLPWGGFWPVEGSHPPGLAPEDSGNKFSVEPGGVDASKDPGGDWQGWRHNLILNWLKKKKYKYFQLLHSFIITFLEDRSILSAYTVKW